jgi:phage shock protein A
VKESLTSRVGRIISGSLSALVAAVENAAPEAVMEEAIREIEGAIDEVRSELGQVAAKKHLASTRLMEESRKHEDLGEKIEIAVAEGREDLAEAGIAKQLDIEAQIPVLEATIAECGSQEKELEGYIRALQAKTREMREELRQYRDTLAQAPAAADEPGPSTRSNVHQRVEKAGSAFDRIIEKASGLPGSGGPDDAGSAARLIELEELARKNRIQERLAALKNRHGA